MKKEYLAPELQLVKFEFATETLMRPSAEVYVNNVFDEMDDETDSGYGFSFKPQD